MALKAKARPTRRRKREALVHQHLENVSRDLLERHPELVREFIGRNAGMPPLTSHKWAVVLANRARAS